jgi:hypothetical protein
MNYQIVKEGNILDYPLKFTVDYPEEKRNRLTCFFRIFVAIPILIVMAFLIGTSTGSSNATTGFSVTIGGVGILIIPVVLMILFRQKYPKWWFDWNYALTKFMMRVTVFLYLLRDEYPSTDEEQAVHLELQYPDVKQDLNRWLPLVKWFLAIPHYIVLFFLYIAAMFVLIIAWFAILFTGSLPRGMFDFLVGIERWSLRVSAYSMLLLTDKYPPFSFEE